MQQPRSVTFIDDLPSLEDLEGGRGGGFPPHGAGLPPGSRDRYDKHIRATHHINPDAGMMRMEHYNGPDAGYGPPPPHSQYGTLNAGDQPQPSPPLPPPSPPQPYLNCIDVAKHIQDCPICSKFYKNDNTVYIISIVILAIVCLLLLKRVLNV